MTAENKHPISLASWNMHMGIGADGNRDLQRSIRLLNSLPAQLIGLQEVDNHHSGNTNDLNLLAEHTGRQIIAGPTMQKSSGNYGNALLTSLPVEQISRYDLSFQNFEPRGLLVVKLRWHDHLLTVAVTHLGLRPAERRHQSAKLLAILAEVPSEPLVVMGDFNEWLPWGRPLRNLYRHFGPRPSPPTFPARRPLLALDRILVRAPYRLSKHTTWSTPLARQASDHLPLLAELTYPGSNPEHL